MENESIIRLDFTNCHSALDFHHRIKAAFGFPDWYGCNWSAFYDLLSTDVAETKIIVSGLHALPSSLQELISCFLDVLEDVKKQRLTYGDSFSYEIVG